MDETRIGRVLFRAWRRGFREADLILGPFAEKYARDLPENELTDFEALLTQEDRDLYSWINGTAPPPTEFDTPVLQKLVEFHRNLPVAGGDLSGS